MDIFRAAATGDLDALRKLLAEGADPNVREEGDNVTPLHFAAAAGHVECVRMLLDAGADVHGAGDLHEGNVIGWAARKGNEAVVDLLVARGARHHIFSAMAMGDLDLVRRVVAEDAGALSRRRSALENHQTPLHAALAPPDGLAGTPDYALAALLIELGADVNATDGKGRTAMEVAMLRGDDAAMRLLRDAGAALPAPRESVAAVPAAAARKSVPMLIVANVRETLRWYASIGFRIEETYEDAGEVTFARLSLGDAELTLSPGRDAGPRGVRLWFLVDDIEPLYAALRERQLRAARARLSGGAGEEPPVPFEEDLYEPFYGGRQFSICDLNGLSLIFWSRQ